MGDILTVDEARERLGIGDNDTKLAAVLQSFVTGASQMLDNTVGPVVQGTVSETYSGTRNGAIRPYLYLNQSPVGTVTQIVEYSGTVAGTLSEESNSSKPAAGYLLASPTAGKVLRRANGCSTCFAAGDRNIVVNYTAGRFVSSDLVDERFKVAMTIILKNAFRIFEENVTQFGEFTVPAASFPTFAMPMAVKDLIGDQWNTGSGIGD